MKKTICRPVRSARLARAPAEQKVDESAGKLRLRGVVPEVQIARIVEPKGPAHSGRGKPTGIYAGAAAHCREANEPSGWSKRDVSHNAPHRVKTNLDVSRRFPRSDGLTAPAVNRSLKMKVKVSLFFFPICKCTKFAKRVAFRHERHLRNDVRRKLILDIRDTVAQVELALLEPLDLQLVRAGRVLQS
jgi:hypothetical protein